MGRGAYALARVAVIVRAPAGWLWWPGVLAAGIGALVPGLTGRRIGLLAGAALFLIAAAVVFVVRRRRYLELARDASRAGKAVFLQDRAVTVRTRRRALRWWLLLAFLAAMASSFAVPAAGGLLLAGLGAGLWAKALWLGRWERAHDALLWVRTDRVPRGRPAGKTVDAYQTTGIVAGDATPGGARRPRTAAATAH
ncbi:hypothetical protein VT50_0221755 [Streptomyces antioxidans]|uniref:Integral membrane protein n=1 Tax=Streptomyces antioxidans TaxID=1507734 RepID=A0A1V4D1N8_9ACTN|nr:hypothetical protein [Streptomyces antioxidans]OPF77161.1 hypothetical protein VT50_0221755 [Streptomyces antioxidans]